MTAFVKGSPLQAGSMPRKKYTLPELGKDTFIWVRALTAKEAQQHIIADRPANIEDKPKEKYVDSFILISLCAINEDGSAVFESEGDVKKNFDVSMDSLYGIVDLIMDLSGVPKGKDRTKN